MQEVKIKWATPDIDEQIAYIARVSNPKNQDNKNITGLLQYMIKHGHVSPFEMANVCLEISTTRDIARQILRHRSFSFQEFSQRYADVNSLGKLERRECRFQDQKNRQASIEPDLSVDKQRQITYQWEILQDTLIKKTTEVYEWALEHGIAKEQARAILPEGLTPSKMYMNGTLRSWIFYLQQRLDVSTQKEHREIAQLVLQELRQVAPVTINAFFPSKQEQEEQFSI
jgi:thymidylate synthase (FAD)